MMNRMLFQGAVFASLLIGGPVLADEAPSTADVLGKLHRSNLKEIEMGKMAREHGSSNEAKTFGKMLVKDHTDADKKVSKLAKAEKIDLATTTPAADNDAGKMPMDAGFDAAFGKMMVEDHKKDVSEVKAARDATKDEKLKKLLGGILPVLEKHQATAQKLADRGSKS